MAINYTVQAEVVDISADTPKTEDAFLVDTNVWYWTTYPNATSHIPNQISDYPGYLNNALGASAKIFHSGLTLAELSHIIEKTEREIYERNIGNSIKPKEFRHNLAGQRGRVVSEVQAAWAQVASLAEPLTVTIDSPAATAALNRLQTEKVDGYDLFILESMRSHGVVQVITDDGDFATVPGIQVFTANSNVIQAARAQGRLITR
jgi:predicted nucleic acid-binding protein